MATYTQQEWDAKEQYYRGKIASIVLPPDINPLTIIQINSQIDTLFSEARFEFMGFKRGLEYIKRLKGLMEKDAAKELKAYVNNPNVPKELKPTNETDRQAWISEWMKINIPKNQGFSHDVNTTISIVESRYLFMEAVISILLEKSQHLITDHACLKLDAEVTAGRVGAGAYRMASDPAVPTVVPAPSMPPEPSR